MSCALSSGAATVAGACVVGDLVVVGGAVVAADVLVVVVATVGAIVSAWEPEQADISKNPASTSALGRIPNAALPTIRALWQHLDGIYK